MKKIILIIMLIASMLTLTATVSASEVTYKNLVTDDTTIEDDFKLLGMDINEYYIPKTYNYQKWYVVAMSEAYNADKTIQTYFYLYNPTTHEHLPELTFRYTLNGIQKTFTTDDFLEVDSTRNLYKVKGFIYEYCVKAEINITNIHHYYEEALLEDGDWYTESYNSESNFKATNQHSLITQDVSMELNFNSTLIIEEFEVVSIRIEEDDGFIKDWNAIWGGFSTYLDVHFYNFNFPDRINPDRVDYAKFRYDYKTYEKAIYAGDNGVPRYEKLLSSTGSKEYPFNNESRSLRVNDRSQELTFKTFFLGNRAASNEFGNLPVTDEHKKCFNYDCSVLLDSSYTLREDIKQYSPDLVNGGGYYIDIGDKYTYSTLDDIEFLELHYEENGIMYKCQVVAPIVDEEDITDLTPEPIDPIVPETLWERFIEWFKDNFPKSLIIIVVIAVAIIALCAFAPHLVIGVFKGLFSIVFYIVSLPFRLIGAIFNRGKD